MQAGVTLERQLSKFANLSMTYLNSRGVHQFYTNVFPANTPNSPLPAGFNPNDVVYQYASGGTFKQNQLIVNSSVRLPAARGFIKDLSLFGYYTLNYANSDTGGAGNVPSIPGDISADYGRAAFDVRHRVFFGGTIGAPHGFHWADERGSDRIRLLRYASASGAGCHSRQLCDGAGTLHI
jgi:hypothetical protein